MNEPSATTTSSTALAGRGRTLPEIAFGVFAALALPLVLCAFAGEHVDAVSWTVPLIVPTVVVFIQLHQPVLDSEAARQAADISRWEV